MIKHIGNSLGNFPGPANQTRCFVHTVNLIAKSILKPFDTPKSKEPKSKDVQVFEDAMAEIRENEGNKEDNKEGDDSNSEDDNDNNDDNDKLAMRLDPIRSVLQKVSLRPITLILTSWLTNGE